MATKINFRGKIIFEPGSYGKVVSGEAAPPEIASSGNVMLIDTGIGMAGYCAGSGINGELQQSVDSVYEFDNLIDLQKFIGGGLFWDLAPYLFNPTARGSGVQKVFLASARTTTAGRLAAAFGGATYAISSLLTVSIGAAGSGYTNGVYTNLPITTGLGVQTGTLNVTVAGGIVTAVTINTAGKYTTAPAGSGLVVTGLPVGTGALFSATYASGTTPTGGTLLIKTKAEGTGANGVLLSSVLTRGYAFKFIAGIGDPLKYIFQIWQGTFKGLDGAGRPYQSLEADSKPLLVLQSPEVATFGDLITFLQNDFGFNQQFVLTSQAANGPGQFVEGDLITFTGYNLATAGTESYSGSDLDDVCASIAEEDNTFFLSDRFGDNAVGAENTKLLAHIQNDAEFDKFLFIGGGYDNTKFKQTLGSAPTAIFYNSANVVVVHSGIKIPDTFGFRTLGSIYHAALVLGRTCGLEPQVPVTWKDISIIGLVHELKPKEREYALDHGILHSKNVSGLGWIVNQGINTLQKNTSLQNEDGTSYEISLMRISAQLNKELVLDSRIKFVGGNLFTASAEDVRLFTEGYLLSRTAVSNKDNLLRRYEKIRVTLVDDAWDITYGFFANGPINKLLFTGVSLKNKISI